MKNTIKFLTLFGIAALFTLPAAAGGPPHRNEGVALATDIVRLVKTIITPPPAVVVTPPVVTAPAPPPAVTPPVVVTPPAVVTPPVWTPPAVVVTPPAWTPPPPRYFREPAPERALPPPGPPRHDRGGRR